VHLLADDAPELVTPAGLAAIAGHADAVGVHKTLVIPRTAAGTLGDPSSLVADADAAGLAVHAFTFRDENAFLPANLRRGIAPSDLGDGRAECLAYLAAGVDGLFADNPDTAVAARDLVSAGVPVDQTMRWSS
jgi:glycerophosphoryl diester phosphodiesterase